MLLTSLTMSSPRSPIRRSSPPVASFDRSRREVADSNAPSLAMVEVTSPPAAARGMTVSVFAAPDPDTTSSDGQNDVEDFEVVVRSEPADEHLMCLFEGAGGRVLVVEDG